MRMRLNRDIDFNDDFRRNYMTKEYGNYDKYDKNKVGVDYDEGKYDLGDDKFYENYMNMLRRLPTKEAKEMKEKKRDDIKDIINDKDRAYAEFHENYVDWRTSEDTAARDHELE